MKIECPVCHVEGILEQRGNSSRVIHYQYVNDKRIFVKHALSMMGTDGNSMGTAETVSSFKSTNEAGSTGVEPATPGLKVRCSSLTELRALTLKRGYTKGKL